MWDIVAGAVGERGTMAMDKDSARLVSFSIDHFSHSLTKHLTLEPKYMYKATVYCGRRLRRRLTVVVVAAGILLYLPLSLQSRSCIIRFRCVSGGAIYTPLCAGRRRRRSRRLRIHRHAQSLRPSSNGVCAEIASSVSHRCCKMLL